MSIDPVILRLEADLKRYHTDMNGAQRFTEEKLSAIEARGAKMGQSIKAGFNLAASAAAGFVAANALGMITDQISKGLEYASSLGEVAQQLGVTTDALQEYRYAGSQAGLEQGEVDQSLQQLTRRLGEAANGTKAQAEAFDKLGIAVKDSNGNVLDAGEAIPLIAEALKGVQSPAERAAILMDLFGKSGQKLEPLLAGGAAGVNNLRDAAHELGIVLSSDQIQKADDAADKLSAVKQVLEAKIAGVVADNADAILKLADNLSTLAQKAIDAFNAIQDLANSPIGQVIGKLNQVAGYLNPIGAIQGALDYSGALTPQKPAAKPAPKGSGSAAPMLPRVAGGADLFKTNLAGGGINLGNRAVSGILGSTPGAGAPLAGIDAAVAYTNALEDLTAAARRQLEQDEAQARLSVDVLRSEADIALNRKDRLKAERRILEIEQDIERKRLEEAIAAGDIVDAVKARADLATKQANDGTRLGQDFASPLGRYARDLAQTDVNDRVEGLIIDEIQSVRGSIRSAVEKATGIKDPLISGLIDLMIEQVIIRPLAEALSKQGGGGGGLGGFFASIGSAIFGRASGGEVTAGQFYRVNEAASPGRVEGFIPRGSGTIIPLGQMNAVAGGRGPTLHQSIHIDARGSVNPDGYADHIVSRVRRETYAIVGQGMSQVAKAVPQRMEQYQRDGF